MTCRELSTTKMTAWTNMTVNWIDAASTSMLKLLAAYGAKFHQSNTLHRAAQGGLGVKTEDGCLEVLQWLLREGSDICINQREYEFSGMDMWEEMSMWTALHFAVSSNALVCARFLLENGIDARLQDKRGRTARDLAVELGHEEAVGLLDNFWHD